MILSARNSLTAHANQSTSILNEINKLLDRLGEFVAGDDNMNAF